MTATRVVQLVLQPKLSPSILPKQYVIYQHRPLSLDDSERANLEAKLPSNWHDSKDLLIKFEKYDDGTYYCERNKEYFDYRTRETKRKDYIYTGFTTQEAETLTAVLLDLYSKTKIARVESLFDSITSQIGDVSYVKIKLLDSRDKLLAKSDHIMLPDYPIDEQTREEWKIYRQELRDITKQEAWKSNNLLDVVMPISPSPLTQLQTFVEAVSDLDTIPSDLLDGSFAEYASMQDVTATIKNISGLAVKYELLRTLSRMNLPVFDLDWTELDSIYNDITGVIDNFDGVEIVEGMEKDWWSTMKADLDTTLNSINQKLQSYNIDFTINDILESIIEKIKLSESDNAVNQLIEEIVEEGN